MRWSPRFPRTRRRRRAAARICTNPSQARDSRPWALHQPSGPDLVQSRGLALATSGCLHKESGAMRSLLCVSPRLGLAVVCVLLTVAVVSAQEITYPKVNVAVAYVVDPAW